MSSPDPPSQRTAPVKLAEAKKMTLGGHIVNIFRLVIKELRSIRADPTMLILVAYAFSISVNTVATGAVTEATNLSVGIVDEDDLNCRGKSPPRWRGRPSSRLCRSRPPRSIQKWTRAICCWSSRYHRNSRPTFSRGENLGSNQR